MEERGGKKVGCVKAEHRTGKDAALNINISHGAKERKFFVSGKKMV